MKVMISFAPLTLPFITAISNAKSFAAYMQVQLNLKTDITKLIKAYNI